jgi:hypothetical protein
MGCRANDDDDEYQNDGTVIPKKLGKGVSRVFPITTDM